MTDRCRVVYVRGQGYGYLTPQEWDSVPDLYRRERIHVIALCDTEAEAQAVYARLPKEWQDKPGLHYDNGEWWSSTGAVVSSPTGQEMELFIPADRPVPIVTREHMAAIQGKRPAALTCADRHVLALADRT